MSAPLALFFVAVVVAYHWHFNSYAEQSWSGRDLEASWWVDTSSVPQSSQTLTFHRLFFARGTWMLTPVHGLLQGECRPTVCWETRKVIARVRDLETAGIWLESRNRGSEVHGISKTIDSLVKRHSIIHIAILAWQRYDFGSVAMNKLKQLRTGYEGWFLEGDAGSVAMR